MPPTRPVWDVCRDKPLGWDRGRVVAGAGITILLYH